MTTPLSMAGDSVHPQELSSIALNQPVGIVLLATQLRSTVVHLVAVMDAARQDPEASSIVIHCALQQKKDAYI